MMHMKDRLFIGVYPGGLVYADRGREVSGDYKRLAFLPYDTLELRIDDKKMPVELLEKIKADAAYMRGKAGEQFPTSSSGQTVLLGTKLKEVHG